MSAKLEKHVSLSSGNSTINQQQQIVLETTSNLSLDNKNENNINMLTNQSNNFNINNNNNNNNTESKDEVDFIHTKSLYPPPASLITKNPAQQNKDHQKCSSIMKKLSTGNMSNIYNDCEVKSNLKSSLEKFSFFTLSRRNHHQINQNQSINNNNNNNTINNINLNNNKTNDILNNEVVDTSGVGGVSVGVDCVGNSSGTKPTKNVNSMNDKQTVFKKSHSDQQILTTTTKHKFGKSASIARLLGHTYNTKKIENELLKFKNKTNCNEMIANGCNNDQKIIKKNPLTNFTSNHSNNNNNTRSIERFQMCTNNEDVLTTTTTNNSNYQNNNNSNSSYDNQFNNSNNTIYKTNHTKLNQSKSNQNNSNNIDCNCVSQNQNINNNNNNNNKSHNCNLNKNNVNSQICNNGNTKMNKEVNMQDFQDDHYNDISAKAFRTISRSLGKLWWKKTHSVEISTPDPEYKVSYLGNVLTGWAKGEGCVEKPLNTLWRNYTQNHKPDVIMRVRVCASGLKATTRQHGLTEYWANRVTHCCSPKNYPRVFCWIYRHEGRKLKHELRCHAILCSKESIAQEICNTLRENLDRALHDFKREKILKQNARLSLANSVYENPSLPRRKILLSVGGNNYRPPMERSKSAPKLMAIEEAIGEEEDEETEETNEPEMPSCCQKDSLYPAMTLGRRRCRRGHSIRRTGKACKISFCDNIQMTSEDLKENQSICENASDNNTDICTIKDDTSLRTAAITTNGNNEFNNGATKSKSTNSLGSDDDDLDKLLIHNNYDSASPLAGELLSYFDMKLNAKTCSLTDLTESLTSDTNCSVTTNDDGDISSDDQMLYEASLTIDPSPRPRAALSLENLDNCSDGCEGDCGVHIDFDDEEDELYYRQTAILNLLHRNSMRKLANLSMSSDDSGDSIEKASHHHHHHHLHHHHHHRNGSDDLKHNMDSDEGSISSGCETASTVTNNCEDSSLKYINDDKQADELHLANENSCYSTNDQRQQIALLNDNEMTEIKVSNTTLTLTRKSSSSNHQQKSQNSQQIHHTKRSFTTLNHHNGGSNDISDSEFSDESGYVEYQDQFAAPRRKSQNDRLSLSSTSTSSSSLSTVIGTKH